VVLIGGWRFLNEPIRSDQENCRRNGGCVDGVAVAEEVAGIIATFGSIWERRRTGGRQQRNKEITQR